MDTKFEVESEAKTLSEGGRQSEQEGGRKMERD